MNGRLITECFNKSYIYYGNYSDGMYMLNVSSDRIRDSFEEIKIMKLF